MKEKEIENVTETVKKIEIERLIGDDGEHNDDYMKKTSDDKQ